MMAVATAICKQSPQRKSERVCQQCEVTFTGVTRAKFCTPKCQKNAYRIRRKTERTCADCGKSFLGRRNGRFCSPSCRVDNRDRRPLKVEGLCLVCGETFLKQSTARFCSRSCKDRYRTLHPEESRSAVRHVCPECNAPFFGRANSTYCSVRCQRKTNCRLERVDCTCESCNKKFKARPNSRYCSGACNGRIGAQKRRALKFKAYVEHVSLSYLRKRDRNICQLCHQPVDLKLRYPDLLCATIDHVIPLTKGGEHSKANTQLAHNVCNIRKHNHLPADGGQLLMFSS